MAKPGIDQLLIEAALEPEFCQRLRENPEEVFGDFDLTVEEREILLQPDQRLLPLLGAALARQMKRFSSAEEAPTVASLSAEVEASVAPDATVSALPDSMMMLTVLPCALHENGRFKGIHYVVWMNRGVEGTDPARLAPPAGTELPGQPLAPLRAEVRISATASRDAEGIPRLSFWGSFQPAPDQSLSPPPESAGNVEAPPFQSSLDSSPVTAAVAAVRQAASSERYDRLVDLLHALHQGNVR